MSDLGLLAFLFLLGALWYREVKRQERKDEERAEEGKRPVDIQDMDHGSG